MKYKILGKNIRIGFRVLVMLIEIRYMILVKSFGVLFYYRVWI